MLLDLKTVGLLLNLLGKRVCFRLGIVNSYVLFFQLDAPYFLFEVFDFIKFWFQI